MCFLHVPLKSRPDKGYLQESLNPNIHLVCSTLQEELTQRDERITTKIFEEGEVSKGNPPKKQPAYKTYILNDAGWEGPAREREEVPEGPLLTNQVLSGNIEVEIFVSSFAFNIFNIQSRH